MPAANIFREGDAPRDTLAQGVSDSAAPVLDCLTARLELLDSSELEHHAMLMKLQELHQLCVEKAKDAKTEHQNVQVRLLEAEAQRRGLTPSALVRELVEAGLAPIADDATVTVRVADLHHAIDIALRRAA